MKTLLCLLLACFTAAASAQVSGLKVEVRRNLKTDSQGKTGDTKTQVQSLSMTVENNSTVNYDTLVVRYWFFSRNLQNNDVRILKEGERKASIPPRGRDTTESEDAKTTFTNEHYEISNKGSGRNRRTSSKRIEASGAKIIGYAVHVMDGGKVLATAYSDPAIASRVPGAKK